MERGFIRFVGTLWESGEFEPGIGWETERIARRPIPDTEHRLQLLDESGQFLVEAAVELLENTCKAAGRPGPDSTRIVSYVPFRRGGHSLVLLKGDQVLHRAELSPSRPRISITTLETAEDGKVHIWWKAEHDRPLWFNVVFIDGKKRAILIKQSLSETEMSFDTVDLPGGDDCVVAVLATDGIRSTFVRSEPFHVSDKPPRINILLPSDGEKVVPDQLISLLGNAHDLAGQILPEEFIVWYIDKKVVARGRTLVHTGPFDPGEYCVRMEYFSENQISTAAEVHVSVAERSAEQQEWLRLSLNHCNRSSEYFVANESD